MNKLIYRLGCGFLVRIIVYGDAKNKLISKKIASVLSDCGCVEYMSETSIKTNGSSFDYLICDTETLNRTDFENTVFILKNGFKSFTEPYLTKNSTIIFDGSHMRAAKYAKKFRCHTLDCGTSHQSTVSIAGINSERAAVSIQRNILTVNGAKIEPMDITVNLSSPLPLTLSRQ